MGYRSDIAAVFYKRQPEKGAELIIQTWMESNLGAEWVKDHMQVIEDSGVGFFVDGWKWYNSYAMINEFESMMEKFNEVFCDDRDPLYAWEFVRIGEEDDDIEYRNSTYNECILGVDRTIRVDAPFHQKMKTY